MVMLTRREVADVAACLWADKRSCKLYWALRMLNLRGWLKIEIHC